MRIDTSHKMLPAVKRGKPVKILVDGQEMTGFEGETVATVLMANGRRAYRYPSTKTAGRLPGFFCGMGICYGCTVMIDGYLKRACLIPVVDGLKVLTSPEVIP